MIAQRGKGELTRIVIFGLQLARVKALELVSRSSSHGFVVSTRI